MKKYVMCLLLCLPLSLTFAGCFGIADKEADIVKEEDIIEEADTVKEEDIIEEAEDAPENLIDAEEEMDLEELFQKGMDSYAEKNMEPPVLQLKTDILELENFYPGISYANIKQMYIAMAPDTVSPTEIALVEVADGSDVAAIRDIFQERIDARANDTAYPETSSVWEKNGIVSIEGHYIFMAVMTDDYGIPQEFILEQKVR